MGGVVLVAGARERDPVAAMLAALTAKPCPAHRESFGIDGAMAGAWHAATPGGRRPRLIGGRFVVAFDGEVYAGPPAAETFAEMVRDADFRNLGKINGSFAAVVADAQTGAVVLMADRLASRPIYFWHNGTQIAVASRLRSLLADPRIPRRLSRSALLEFLAHRRTFGSATLFGGISGLVAGEVVTIGPDGRIERSQPAKPRFRPEIAGRRDYEAALTTALRGSVERRLADGAAPLLLLSGGFDSRVVAAAGVALGRPIPCASMCAWDNAEIAAARAVAKAAGSPFEFHRVEPAAVAAAFDSAVEATDGVHPAPPSLFPAYAGVAGAGAAALLNGHLLDIFFRGTYLPKRRLPLGRSRPSLPWLAASIDPSPSAVSRSHHIRTEWPLARNVLAEDAAKDLVPLAAAGVARAIEAVDIHHPADAHHAFLLHALARHTSHGDFVAATPFMEFRTPALDGEILDLYFAAPAEWKAGRVGIHRAAESLAPPLFRVADANTGYPADWPYSLQLFLGLARAAVRRAGLAPRRENSDPSLTGGSWLNWPEYFRREPAMRRRIEALPSSAALLDTGLLRAEGLAEVVNGHLAGTRPATKLLHTLATLDSWLGRTGYSGVTD